MKLDGNVIAFLNEVSCELEDVVDDSFGYFRSLDPSNCRNSRPVESDRLYCTAEDVRFETVQSRYCLIEFITFV